MVLTSSSLKFAFNLEFSYTSFTVVYPARRKVLSQHTRDVLDPLVTRHDVRECSVPYRQTGDESKGSKGRHPSVIHGRNRLFKLGVREKTVNVKA